MNIQYHHTFKNFQRFNQKYLLKLHATSLVNKSRLEVKWVKILIFCDLCTIPTKIGRKKNKCPIFVKIWNEKTHKKHAKMINMLF